MRGYVAEIDPLSPGSPGGFAPGDPLIFFHERGLKWTMMQK